MEADNDEREQPEQAVQHRHQEALGDRRHRADVLVQGDLDEVDQVHALGAVEIAMVDGVDAQKARHAVPLRRPLGNKQNRTDARR